MKKIAEFWNIKFDIQFAIDVLEPDEDFYEDGCFQTKKVEYYNDGSIVHITVKYKQIFSPNISWDKKAKEGIDGESEFKLIIEEVGADKDHNTRYHIILMQEENTNIDELVGVHLFNKMHRIKHRLWY